MSALGILAVIAAIIGAYLLVSGRRVAGVALIVIAVVAGLAVASR